MLFRSPEPAIIEHHHFFRCIAYACWVVDHERLALDPFEQMRCGDITHVKRRVLPHQHDVDVGSKVDPLGLTKAVMRAFNALQIIYGMRPCSQTITGIERERTNIIMPDIIPPRLRRVAAAAESLVHKYNKGTDEVRIDVILVAPWRLPRHLVNVWHG